MLCRAVLAAGCLLISGQSQADGVFALKLSNDFFGAGVSDGHYTHGLEGSYAFAPGPSHWTSSLAERLPGWQRESLDAVAWRVGQRIYTPERIEIETLIEDDRPYAGYLYAGLSLYGNSLSPQWRINDALSLEAGLVGPGSGARLVQESFHDLVQSNEPEGWHHQLHQEPTLTLAWQRHWWYRDRLGLLELEYGPATGIALGNLYDYASAGLGIRLGPRLDHQYATFGAAPAATGNPLFTRAQGLDWHLFVHAQGRFVARNLFIDGNTFEDSHRVDRRQWVGDFQVGGALRWTRYSLSLSTLARTREFRQQADNDFFGILTLTTRL